MKQLANPLSHQRTVAKWLVITQQRTLGKSLVIAIRLCCQKALHSHSAKSPKDGDINCRLTTAKSLVMSKSCRAQPDLLIFLSSCHPLISNIDLERHATNPEFPADRKSNCAHTDSRQHAGQGIVAGRAILCAPAQRLLAYHGRTGRRCANPGL